MTAESKPASDSIRDDEAFAPSEAQIRDYLKNNVDFFDRHPDILDQLQISHSSGGAVSLVEKQVSVLRERNVEMRKRLTNLTSNARDNDKLYELTRKLVLQLLEAGDREQLAAAFIKGLQEDFGVEHVCFILFGDPDSTSRQCRIESADSARIEVGALIRGRKPVCGTLRGEELAYLFPEAGKVGSAAVVPLVHGGDLGVIAVGSEDPHYYSASMGTLFLSHVGDVLVRLIPRLAHEASTEAD